MNTTFNSKHTHYLPISAVTVVDKLYNILKLDLRLIYNTLIHKTVRFHILALCRRLRIHRLPVRYTAGWFPINVI